MIRKQTHCLQGHLLTYDENVYLSKNGGRGCVKCAKQRYILKSRGYSALLPRLTCDKGHKWISENIVYYGLMRRKRSCKICKDEAAKRFEESDRLKRKPDRELAKVRREEVRASREGNTQSLRAEAFKKAAYGKKRYLYDYKVNHPCVKCGYKDVRALDFHHVDPKTKLFNVTENKNISIDELILEIEKCIILCKNCHAKHHNVIPKFIDRNELWIMFGGKGVYPSFCCQTPSIQQ